MELLPILLEILNYTRLIISSSEFKFRAVVGNHFIRNRKMGLEDYIRYLVSNERRSMQSELSSYIRQLRGDQASYSKQAFSKQRQYIRPEAILELLDITIDRFYHRADFKTFHGFLVAAIDGSRYNLPCTPELQEKYGEQISSGEAQVQALGSCLYDVLNGMVLHCLFDHCKSSERNLAKKHVDSLKNIPYDKFLMVYDRGYPSYELIEDLQSKGLSYLMRCPSEFVKSFLPEEPDKIVLHAFTANKKKPVTMRVITLTLNSGEKEYLITNLLDDCYTLNDFYELYHARWGIETLYGSLKNKFEIENFTGISDIAIRQDYYATMYLSNLTAVMIFEMKDSVQAARRKDNKYQYQQNINRSIQELRCNVVELLLTDSSLLQNVILLRITSELVRAVTPIRENRSFERKRKHKSMKYPQNMKRG